MFSATAYAGTATITDDDSDGYVTLKKSDLWVSVAYSIFFADDCIMQGSVAEADCRLWYNTKTVCILHIIYVPTSVDCVLSVTFHSSPNKMSGTSAKDKAVYLNDYITR